MSKFEYHYTVDIDSNYDDRIIFSTKTKYSLTDDLELEWLVQDCADDYFHNHDGWDTHSWTRHDVPLKFVIWVDAHTKRIFNVWCNYKPDFTSVEIT